LHASVDITDELSHSPTLPAEDQVGHFLGVST
jgi:hypothetical protein